jgi:prephenate dehydrogenase
MTRVASADPDQWAQILSANRREVARAISVFRRELARLERALGSASLRRRLRSSHRFRRPLFHGL